MQRDERINKINVTQQIIKYIKGNIESGVWAEGDRIDSEANLATRLGVSRASVRVAISQYIAFGVLESVHGKGTFVRSRKSLVNDNAFTEEDCADYWNIMQFRLSLEPDTAYFAAINATEEDIKLLKECVNHMDNQDIDTDEFAKYDMMLHCNIAKITGNQLYEKCISQVFELTRDKHLKLAEAFGKSSGRYYHTNIVKAIEEHDAEKARSTMREHLNTIKTMM